MNYPSASSPYARRFKRFVDIAIAVLAIVLTLPIALVVGIFLAFTNRGRVFFRQERIGLDEKAFELLKFRTLMDDGITPVMGGSFLRRTSLDELPQLWNVLKGDMSLVGPRPLFERYLQYYSPYHRQRHLVKPGITGLAQVRGRNALSWQQRFDYDLEYVKRVGWWLDMTILWKTIGVLFDFGSADFHRQDLRPFDGYDEETQ